MKKWETQDERYLAQLLVGEYFGDRPEEKLDVIRADRKNRAAWLCRKLGCNQDSVVLEVGSGMGFTSKHVANEVKHLYCCDISTSFLNVARKECADVSNIEFIPIDNQQAQPFPFADEFCDIIFADAVFIHLNLYDIYWYFSEFQRLVKDRGKVYINILDASKLDLDLIKFSEMAGHYQKNRAALAELLCWNSIDAVTTVAAHHGFRLTFESRLRRLRRRRSGSTVDLIFIKR